jgi:hypothetical protein
MKSVALVSATIACTTSAFAVQEVLPQPLPSARYDKMIEASPFALATKTEAPVEKGPGPFVHLTVATIAQLKDPDGKTRDIVTFKSRADSSTFTLEGNEPNKEGFQIAGIEWSDRVGETKVTLKKGTEFGTVEFDKANVTGPPQGANPQARPGGAVIPGAGANPAQRNPLRPTVPAVPRPTVPPVPSAVPRPTQPNAAQPAVPQPGVTVPGAASPSPRRVRVINTRP